MSFDLNKLEDLAASMEAGEVLEIVHPVTGEPTGFKIRVAAMDSERVKRVQRVIANNNLRKQNRKPTIEEIETNGRKVTAAAIISWEGLERDGKPMDCTPENIAAVIANPLIMRQIDEFTSDASNFMKA